MGARSRRVARARVGDLVRRREAQPRLELRAPLGARRAGRRGGGRLAERGREARGAHLRGALGRGDALRRGTRGAGCRERRPRGAVPADVTAGRDRLARLRASRRGPGAGLLGLRSARDRVTARSLGGQGRRHRGRLAAPRPRGADEGARGRGARGVALRRARGRLAAARRGRPDAGAPRRVLGRGGRGLPGRARAARGRLRAPVPAHLHVGDDRPAEGVSSTSRAASSSRSRARSPTRPTRGPAT